MNPPVTVSVVIPVLNSVRFIAVTLDSVLAQTAPPLEIIIVDDASTDGTAALIEGYAERHPQLIRHIVRHDARGIYSALNRGIAEAQGEAIAFISADDVWMPEKLALQTRLLGENPHFGYVRTHFERLIDADAPPDPATMRPTHAGLQTGDLLEATMARKRLFTEHGGFDEQYRVSGDVEWFARLSVLGVPFGVVERVLLHKRMHDRNTAMRDPDLTRRELLHILHRSARAHRSRPAAP